MIKCVIRKYAGQWTWLVWKDVTPRLYFDGGVCFSQGQALRDMRNFLKRNQNWIYD